MKRIVLGLLSIVALSATSAFAGDATFNYTFFGNTSGRYTMVACSYAEHLVEKWMMTFGATDIRVRCTGGIQPPTGVWPLSLRVEYTPPVIEEIPNDDPNGEAGKYFSERIEIRSDWGRSNCDFDTGLMRALLRDFKNIQVVSSNTACFTSQSPYRYVLDVTLPM